MTDPYDWTHNPQPRQRLDDAAFAARAILWTTCIIVILGTCLVTYSELLAAANTQLICKQIVDTANCY